MKNRLVDTVRELAGHAPYTLAGAILGVVCMVAYNRFLPRDGQGLFAIFHPAHILLSAWATTLLFSRRVQKSAFWKILLVGYLGSIGIATLSDSVIPYLGEDVLGISVPSHSGHHSEHVADDHESENLEQAGHAEVHHEHPILHLGFIEHPFLVNGSALVGIFLALFIAVPPKLPHFMHVLVSVWASMAHIMMNTAKDLSAVNYLGIVIVLFIAVLVPCCLSDIVFPTLVSKTPIGHHHHHHES